MMVDNEDISNNSKLSMDKILRLCLHVKSCLTSDVVIMVINLGNDYNQWLLHIFIYFKWCTMYIYSTI